MKCLHIVDTNHLSEGMIVADDVYSKSGQLILRKNFTLTRQMIAHLSFYKINSIPVNEGELSEETRRNIDHKKEVEQTHLNKLMDSPEYRRFRKKYVNSLDTIENNFNDIIMRNAPINEQKIIFDTIDLFEENQTTYSLFGMLHTMKQIDDSTFAHSMNVSIISRLLGIWLNLPKTDLDQLTLAGLLHDIGKCQVPNEILLKPGKLTSQEFDFVKKHPEFGYEILRNQEIDPRVKNAVLLHHERYDGSGYPYGYAGDRLNQFESIVAIADVYDAMTSNRCYRSALCPFEVIAQFEHEGLHKYHALYILTFLERIADSYLNSDILLSNDAIGRVVYINKRLTRPIIQLENHDFVNLEDHPELYIEALI